METAPTWLEIINTGGVIGLLVLNLWMFATGKVIPKTTVDAMIKALDDRTVKLANEIKEGISDAVRQGIVTGIHEVRNIQQDK